MRALLGSDALVHLTGNHVVVVSIILTIGEGDVTIVCRSNIQTHTHTHTSSFCTSYVVIRLISIVTVLFNCCCLTCSILRFHCHMVVGEHQTSIVM